MPVAPGQPRVTNAQVAYKRGGMTKEEIIQALEELERYVKEEINKIKAMLEA
ncbi:MAG: hypothetical protein ACFFBD_01960 [Candidatus Hodarchaeota archaeon]